MEDFAKKTLFKGRIIENLSKEELLEAIEILYDEKLMLQERIKDLYKLCNSKK